MERDGKRFNQGCVLEWQRIRRTIKNALGHGDVLGEATVLAIIFARYAQHTAIIAKVYFATAAVLTLATINRGIKGDMVSGGPVCDPLTETFDHTRSLMPHDNRWPTPTGAAIHPMDIAAANTTS